LYANTAFLSLVLVAYNSLTPRLFHAQVPSGNAPKPLAGERLVWSDEFNGATAPAAPDSANWEYVTGNGESGGEQIYCKFDSTQLPCNPTAPNSHVGADGNLHIIVQKTSGGVYTSAFLQTKKLRSFRYGRIEARMKLPAGQGMWPAFWLLGDNISQVSWPRCGEIDIMENLGRQPGRIYGTLHAAGYASPGHGKTYDLPRHRPFADGFHIFGAIWSPKKIQLYVDSPTNIYATFTAAELSATEEWPFDTGKFYIVLNTAVGGNWGGSPNATTMTPSDMLIDYVRVYQKTAEDQPARQ
jgi:beta-glucanase (GH16 family)